jgi:hypothetical protein
VQGWHENSWAANEGVEKEGRSIGKEELRGENQLDKFDGKSAAGKGWKGEIVGKDPRFRKLIGQCAKR